MYDVSCNSPKDSGLAFLPHPWQCAGAGGLSNQAPGRVDFGRLATEHPAGGVSGFSEGRSTGGSRLGCTQWPLDSE